MKTFVLAVCMVLAIAVSSSFAGQILYFLDGSSVDANVVWEQSGWVYYMKNGGQSGYPCYEVDLVKTFGEEEAEAIVMRNQPQKAQEMDRHPTSRTLWQEQQVQMENYSEGYGRIRSSELLGMRNRLIDAGIDPDSRAGQRAMRQMMLEKIAESGGIVVVDPK